MAFKHALAAVVFALSASVVLAVPYDNYDGPDSCGNNQFWYSQKECCLPHGGPSYPPPPPPGKSCPPSTWWWHPDKGCCVPNHPPPPNPPPPQCSKGWDWNYGTQCCEPHHNPPPPPPKPSHGYNGGGDHDHDYDNGDDHHGGDDNGYNGQWKKAKRNASAPPKCPRSYQACPLGDLSGAEFECVDTSAELRSCGGCASLNQGQDCTTIKGAWNVGCEVGECTVYTCALGFKVSTDKRSCVPVF